jgi:hypothetical protein
MIGKLTKSKVKGSSNQNTHNIGFKSGTKATTNPTSNSGNLGAAMGQPSHSGAHGNKAKRSLAY